MYYIIIFSNSIKYKYNFIYTSFNFNLKFTLNWDVIPCRSGVVHVTKGLPDSLTTWEVRAIGVFNNGEITAFIRHMSW